MRLLAFAFTIVFVWTGPKCEAFHMKMSSACSFIFMQIKVILIKMVSHFDSL